MISLFASDWEDYALLDSGGQRKLERYAQTLLIRPEPQADWKPALPRSAWREAHAEFRLADRGQGGAWRFYRSMERRWPMRYKHLSFWVQAQESRQVGVFPENANHWDWIQNRIVAGGRPLHVLNLFGYTGLATLAAASAGARVTHVDASKKAVRWAKDNQELSGLVDRPVRWIVEDALKYLRREQRRGVRYDGIIMDPPAFGRGPGGEVWAFDALFQALCQACRDVLSQSPLFVVATFYSKNAGLAEVRACVAGMVAGADGRVSAGQLATREASAGRVIPNALFVRWQRH